MTKPLDDARAKYPHVRAAFINAISEEGTKAEAIEWLQKQWNETCALRAELKDLRAAPVPRCEANPVAWLCHDLIIPCVSVTTKKELAAQRKNRPDDWRVEPLYDTPRSRSDAVSAKVERDRIIELCATVAEGFDAACNSSRMKLFVEAGLVTAIYKRDGEIGAAIRELKSCPVPPLAPSPSEAGREAIARAIYLAVYESRGGRWEANEAKGVWHDIADRFCTILRASSDHGTVAVASGDRGTP